MIECSRIINVLNYITMKSNHLLFVAKWNHSFHILFPFVQHSFSIVHKCFISSSAHRCIVETKNLRYCKTFIRLFSLLFKRFARLSRPVHNTCLFFFATNVAKYRMVASYSHACEFDGDNTNFGL